MLPKYPVDVGALKKTIDAFKDQQLMPEDSAEYATWTKFIKEEAKPNDCEECTRLRQQDKDIVMPPKKKKQDVEDPELTELRKKSRAAKAAVRKELTVHMKSTRHRLVADWWPFGSESKSRPAESSSSSNQGLPESKSHDSHQSTTGTEVKRSSILPTKEQVFSDR